MTSSNDKCPLLESWGRVRTDLTHLFWVVLTAGISIARIEEFTIAMCWKGVAKPTWWHHKWKKTSLVLLGRFFPFLAERAVMGGKGTVFKLTTIKHHSG